MIPVLPRSTLFPYTTLFRSRHMESGTAIDAKYLRCIPGLETVPVPACDGTRTLRIHGQALFDGGVEVRVRDVNPDLDRKSTRLNSSHSQISYAVFCLKKKIN